MKNLCLYLECTVCVSEPTCLLLRLVRKSKTFTGGCKNNTPVGSGPGRLIEESILCYIRDEDEEVFVPLLPGSQRWGWLCHGSRPFCSKTSRLDFSETHTFGRGRSEFLGRLRLLFDPSRGTAAEWHRSMRVRVVTSIQLRVRADTACYSKVRLGINSRRGTCYECAPTNGSPSARTGLPPFCPVQVHRI